MIGYSSRQKTSKLLCKVSENRRDSSKQETIEVSPVTFRTFSRFQSALESSETSPKSDLENHPPIIPSACKSDESVSSIVAKLRAQAQAKLYESHSSPIPAPQVREARLTSAINSVDSSKAPIQHPMSSGELKIPCASSVRSSSVPRVIDRKAAIPVSGWTRGAWTKLGGLGFSGVEGNLLENKAKKERVRDFSVKLRFLNQQRFMPEKCESPIETVPFKPGGKNRPNAPDVRKRAMEFSKTVPPAENHLKTKKTCENIDRNSILTKLQRHDQDRLLLSTQ